MAYFKDSVTERFISKVKFEQSRVEIITRNGYHMFGVVKDGDDRALLVEVKGREQLVMMPTVSTIIPIETKEAEHNVG